MKKEDLNNILKELTYKSELTFLDYGKDKAEMDTVAKKAGVKFPARDLAMFKCVYAFIDEQNKNGCTLPSEEVMKALDTLAFKAIDFDHLRKRVVGTWIDASVDKNKIIAYGLFYKGNFPDDYEEIKKMFDDGNLKVSFEAYGNRVMTGTNTYDLTDIEFAGGGILINTKPAFSNATVLELSNKDQDNFIREDGTQLTEKEKKYLEVARYYLSDIQTVHRQLQEVQCPMCTEPYSQMVDSIDFANGTMDTTCMNCKAKNHVDMKPRTHTYPSASKEDVAISHIYNRDKDNKIQKEETDKINKNKSSVEENSKMDELKAQLEKLQKEFATLQEQIAAKDAEISTLKAELVKAATEKDEAIVKAKAETLVVAERKAKLGDFAKDMKDEDLLNDDKFEKAQLQKENADLKAKIENPEKGSVAEGMEKGSKGGDKTIPAWRTKNSKVKELAFGK